VKISAFAIDGKAPHSDLYVSPAHAIYLDGILIRASDLVNGVTIMADAKPEALSLTYSFRRPIEKVRDRVIDRLSRAA
jgi:hypothetical protein